jgi:hypothetical protein
MRTIYFEKPVITGMFEKILQAGLQHSNAERAVPWSELTFCELTH